MALEEDVAAGLLNWINSLEVTDPTYTVDELATGEVLWKILQLIDPTAFSSSLPEDPTRFDSSSTQSWIPKWTNLKHIYDALSNFLIEECDQTLPLFRGTSGAKSNPDLKAIAQNSSIGDAVILLKLCVVAAVNCQERLAFLTAMQELSGGVQRVLMETLQEAQSDDPSRPGSDGVQEQEEDYEYEEDELVDEESYQEDDATNVLHENRAIPTGGNTTSDLAYEERLAKVIADSQRLVHEKIGLQRHIDESDARYGTLQERYDRLQDELNESNSRLTAVLSGRAGDDGKSMQAKNETLIATLEARVAEYEADLDGLRKQNEVLKIKAERVQKLQDDYDEIKIERDNLSRKANTAEKYRLKLEAGQELEKENASLKTKIGDLQGQLRTSDTKTASSSNLAREVEEYRRMLPAIEQDRHELNEMKKRVEFEFHMLQARYSESEEQLRRSRQEVEDLQGRLREYDDGAEISHTRTEISQEDENQVDGRDLETEEADFAAAEARLAEALQQSEAMAEATNNGDDKSTLGLDLTGLDAENGISEDELRAIMSAMRAQMAAGTSAERETGMKMQKRMVIMLEKVRSRNIALVEQIRKQSDTISELEKRPERVPEEVEQAKSKREGMEESELEQQLDEQDVLIENLRREIRLVCSAWYEQNQRLATLGSGGGAGAVALMRLKDRNGIEEPRSFLGRQRSLVGKAIFGGNGKTERG